MFNKETVIADLFLETISPRAFDKALSNPDDVRALFNHDPNVLLGRTSSGAYGDGGRRADTGPR